MKRGGVRVHLVQILIQLHLAVMPAHGKQLIIFILFLTPQTYVQNYLYLMLYCVFSHKQHTEKTENQNNHSPVFVNGHNSDTNSGKGCSSGNESDEQNLTSVESKIG